MNPDIQRTTGYLTTLYDTFLKGYGLELNDTFKDTFKDIFNNDKIEFPYSFNNKDHNKTEYCNEETYSKVADMYYGNVI